jgi:hypothetical protein
MQCVYHPKVTRLHPLHTTEDCLCRFTVSLGTIITKINDCRDFRLKLEYVSTLVRMIQTDLRLLDCDQLKTVRKSIYRKCGEILDLRPVPKHKRQIQQIQKKTCKLMTDLEYRFIF